MQKIQKKLPRAARVFHLLLVCALVAFIVASTVLVKPLIGKRDGMCFKCIEEKGCGRKRSCYISENVGNGDAKKNAAAKNGGDVSVRITPDGVESRRRGSVPDETRKRGSVFYDALEEETPSMRYIPTPLPNYRPRGSVAMDDPDSLLRSIPTNKRLRQTIIIKEHLDEPTIKLELKGYPGDLTKEEVETCLAFRKAINEQDDPAFKEMTVAFKDVEDEPFALCRFLRGRQFDLDSTIQMMLENIPTWNDGKPHNFYPTIEGAVGCPAPVFLTQFPYFYSGIAKNGCPVAYLQAGSLQVEGIECVTDLENVQYYMWNAFMYQFKREVARAQAADPTAVRCESVTVIDLKGLASSQMNKKTIEALKSVATIGCCFPELLNQMVILNASFAFSLAWKVIKQFLTPRTVAKIEIFSNEKAGRQRLLEIIDSKELLADYGGDGPSFEQLAHDAENKTASIRQVAELISPGGKAVPLVELSSTEMATVKVYTRSTSGPKITLLKDKTTLKVVELKATGEGSSASYCTEIVMDESGPANLKVEAKSPISTDLFLVHVEVLPLNSR